MCFQVQFLKGKWELWSCGSSYSDIYQKVIFVERVCSLLFDYRVGQGLFQKVIFEAWAGCCPARPCIVGKSCKKKCLAHITLCVFFKTLHWLSMPTQIVLHIMHFDISFYLGKLGFGLIIMKYFFIDIGPS